MESLVDERDISLEAICSLGLGKAVTIIISLAKCTKCIGSMESLVDRDISLKAICSWGLRKGGSNHHNWRYGTRAPVQ